MKRTSAMEEYSTIAFDSFSNSDALMRYFIHIFISVLLVFVIE